MLPRFPLLQSVSSRVTRRGGGGESPHSPRSLCTCVGGPASLQAFHSLSILVSGVTRSPILP